MARFFLSQTQIEGDTVNVEGADAHHIARVLRMRVGETLIVCDMQKNEYLCSITDIHDHCVTARIRQRKRMTRNCHAASMFISPCRRAIKWNILYRRLWNWVQPL